MRDDDQDWVRGPGPHTAPDPRDEWQRLRDLALTVGCPDCQMPKGAACVNRDGGLKPAVLKRFPAHARRIARAREAAKR